jgi:hypothetical protein
MTFASSNPPSPGRQASLNRRSPVAVGDRRAPGRLVRYRVGRRRPLQFKDRKAAPLQRDRSLALPDWHDRADAGHRNQPLAPRIFAYLSAEERTSQLARSIPPPPDIQPGPPRAESPAPMEPKWR